MIEATMQAATLRAPGQFEIGPVPLPTPSRGEVRVQLESCGVCASGLAPWEGRPWFTYPFAPGALGHEATGTVEALGPESDPAWRGQRVALLGTHGFAEYEVIATDRLVPLPASLAGQPFPGEPLGCALNIFARSTIERGTRVAIVGAGFLGLLLAQLARVAGARMLVLTRRPTSQCQAEALGSETIPWGGRAEMVAAVRERLGGDLCDVVLEVTGHADPLELAGELTRERGRLVIAGYHQDGRREVNLQLWNWRGLDVINAHERDPAIYLAGIRQAVEAVAAGRLVVAPLLTHFLPLTEINQAFRLTRDRPDGFIKAMITFDA